LEFLTTKIRRGIISGFIIPGFIFGFTLLIIEFVEINNLIGILTLYTIPNLFLSFLLLQKTIIPLHMKYL
jgi:hypothetical protein